MGMMQWRDFARRFEPTAGWRWVATETAYTHGKDLQAICMLAKASGAKHAVEIGTAFGHTAVALARTLPNAKITTIGTTQDLAGTDKDGDGTAILDADDEGSFIRKQEAAIRDRITSLSVKPTPRVSLLDEVDVEPFEFAFVDGEHTWQGIAEDTKAVLRGIDHDGIIVWDDYTLYPELAAFVNTLNDRSNARIMETDKTRIVFVELDEETHASLTKAVALL